MTGILQAQEKAVIDALRPQEHIPPFLLHKEKKDKLNPEDEELEPEYGPVGVSRRVW